MAKRELSSTLRNLKFMQRASQGEGKVKADEEIKPVEDFNFAVTPIKKCVVLMEGDPHPRAIKGRRSFQGFNPSIDKLNAEAKGFRQVEPPTSCSGSQNGKISERDDSMNGDGSNSDSNGILKRKQSDPLVETDCRNKLSENAQGNHQQSSPGSSRNSCKQKKREKLDWSVLRPPKPQNKRE